MPQVIITAEAAIGLKLCRQYLAAWAPEAAQGASEAIDQKFVALETSPWIGRPYRSKSAIDLRELIIPCGNWSYLSIYHHDEAQDAVVVLSFRQQKEETYN